VSCVLPHYNGAHEGDTILVPIPGSRSSTSFKQTTSTEATKTMMDPSSSIRNCSHFWIVTKFSNAELFASTATLNFLMNKASFRKTLIVEAPSRPVRI